MKLRHIAILILILSTMSFAQYPENFEQAKNDARHQKKPILMEFFKADCIYCELAKREAATKDTMQIALQSVVHFPVDVKSDVGQPLVIPYFVGNTYPVFILTDSSGDVINRWTGYSNAGLFAQKLKQYLSDLTTIRQRYARLEADPHFEDALVLAKYNDEIGENLEAAKLFLKAQTLEKVTGQDFSYEIFRNTADAVWNGKAPFDRLTAQADKYLSDKSGNKILISRAIRIIDNVAIRTGHTTEIAKYLQMGIDAFTGATDDASKELRSLLVADHNLFIKHDTTRAILVRKSAFGPDLDTNPEKYFSFAKWCLDRRINLDEAQSYAQKAVAVAAAGKFKASILSTLANIYEARGKHKDAIAAFTQATQEDPENDYYQAKLDSLNVK